MAFFREAEAAQAMGTEKHVQVSSHFNLREFQCRGLYCCGNKAYVSINLIKLLERIRAACSKYAGTEVPVTITSGYRCWEHNTALYEKYGQKPSHSKHCLGQAADITVDYSKVPFVTFQALCRREVQKVQGGMGVYENDKFIHVDVAVYPPNRRW